MSVYVSNNVCERERERDNMHVLLIILMQYTSKHSDNGGQDIKELCTGGHRYLRHDRDHGYLRFAVEPFELK